MTKNQDVEQVKSHVEFAIEVLLRAVNEHVIWKPVSDNLTPEAPFYTALPGIYTTALPQTTIHPQQREDDAVLSSLAQAPGTEGEICMTRIILHSDNTFAYLWSMERSGPRAVNVVVEMEGRWAKLELCRTQKDKDSQRISLTTNRIRFQRLSHYDPQNQTWKLHLRTLTRDGSDWARVGLAEHCVPPIVMIFLCRSGFLESTGAAVPAQIMSNSLSCRILAGLTKKIANKLGAPLDIMTDKWLPARGVQIMLAGDTSNVKVKRLNPFYWYIIGILCALVAKLTQLCVFVPTSKVLPRRCVVVIVMLFSKRFKPASVLTGTTDNDPIKI